MEKIILEAKSRNGNKGEEAITFFNVSIPSEYVDLIKPDNNCYLFKLELLEHSGFDSSYLKDPVGYAFGNIRLEKNGTFQFYIAMQKKRDCIDLLNPGLFLKKEHIIKFKLLNFYKINIPFIHSKKSKLFIDSKELVKEYIYNGSNSELISEIDLSNVKVISSTKKSYSLEATSRIEKTLNLLSYFNIPHISFYGDQEKERVDLTLHILNKIILLEYDGSYFHVTGKISEFKNPNIDPKKKLISDYKKREILESRCDLLLVVNEKDNDYQIKKMVDFLVGNDILSIDNYDEFLTKLKEILK